MAGSTAIGRDIVRRLRAGESTRSIAESLPPVEQKPGECCLACLQGVGMWCPGCPLLADMKKRAKT